MCVRKSRIIQGSVFLTSIFLSACGGVIPASEPAAVPVQATAPAITSIGTDFYLTLPDNLYVSGLNLTPVTNKLIIAAADATTGAVTFNGVTTPFSVAAHGQTVLTLDPAVVLTSNEVVEPKGVHVATLAPVSAHMVSQTTVSADGYMALPTPGLGTQYYVMSAASARYNGSEFAIVATQDNTTINITPSAAVLTRLAGIAFTVVMNRGETYQIVNPTFADMTGTLITSDKPVAVFGGHRCADIPSGTGYCDYLVEQLPSVSIWGRTHHTVPFSGRARYTVRVLAAQDGTTFTTLPANLIGTLNAGQFADVVLTGAAEIVSSNPVLVAQFMHGYADDTAAKGDPSMVMVTPAETGMTQATFGIHGLPGTTTVFMNVVTETAALANLTLDNVAVNPANFTAVAGSSLYSVATLSVTPGAHTLLGPAKFSATVYDYGIASDAVSYAYPVASVLSTPAPVITDPTPIPDPSSVLALNLCVDDHGHENAEENSGYPCDDRDNIPDNTHPHHRHHRHHSRHHLHHRHHRDNNHGVAAHG